VVGPAAKREAVAHLQAAFGLSERRACSLIAADVSPGLLPSTWLHMVKQIRLELSQADLGGQLPKGQDNSFA